MEANESYNRMPSLVNATGNSPIQLFESSNIEINPKHYKPFGSPVYVLNSHLQSGLPFHKWSRRARVGIYLRHSPVHAQNVALVLDRDPGYVSPQFHVQFDRNFHTCRQVTLSANWPKATGFGKFVSDGKFEDQPKSKKKSKETKSSEPTKEPIKKHKQITLAVGNDEDGNRKSLPRVKRMESKLPSHKEARTVNTDPEGVAITPKRTRVEATTNVDRSDRSIPTGKVHETNVSDTQKRPKYLKPTRSGRSPKPNRDYYEAKICELLNEECVLNQSDIPGEIYCLETLFPRDDSTHMMDPFQEYKVVESDKTGQILYAAKAIQSDPDTMYYHQAMKEKDKNEFKKAMVREVTSQINEGIYSLIERCNVPEGAKVYPAVWQMKRKRHITTQEIKKHKARCNLDEGYYLS